MFRSHDFYYFPFAGGFTGPTPVSRNKYESYTLCIKISGEEAGLTLCLRLASSGLRTLLIPTVESAQGSKWRATCKTCTFFKNKPTYCTTLTPCK